jgi:8-oxo-dGTP diphosphatase
MKQNKKLHIVAVVAVIRNQKGQYLVLKRGEHEIAYPGKYTFPGGKIEGNDTTKETLEREVKEETGLKLKKGKILLKDKSFLRPDGQTTKVFSYLCETEMEEPVKISKDFTEYKWVTLSELKKLPHVGIEEEIITAEKLINSGINLEKFGTNSVKE